MDYCLLNTLGWSPSLCHYYEPLRPYIPISLHPRRHTGLIPEVNGRSNTRRAGRDPGKRHPGRVLAHTVRTIAQRSASQYCNTSQPENRKKEVSKVQHSSFQQPARLWEGDGDTGVPSLGHKGLRLYDF